MADDEKQKAPALLRLEPRESGTARGDGFLAEALGRPRTSARASVSLEFTTDLDSPLTVGEGPAAGSGWSELVDSFGEDLVGARGMSLLDRGLVFEVRFEAADKMDSPMTMLAEPGEDSHPERTVSREAVMIIESGSRSKIYHGRRHDLSPERFFNMARNSPGRMVLQDHPASPGLVFQTAPGVPYCLGMGAMAYVVSCRFPGREGRVRGIANGGFGKANLKRDLVTAPVPSERMGIRPLGWIDGMNSFTFLAASQNFAVSRLDLRDEYFEPAGNVRSGFSVLTGLHGKALLFCGNDTQTLERGRTVVLSAVAPGLRINPGEDGAVILSTRLCDPVCEVETLLRDRRFSQREIEGLYGFFGKTVP